MSRILVRLGAFTAAVALTMGGTFSAVAQESSAPPTTTTPSTEAAAQAALPDLKVTATLGKDHYSSHELVHATVTITNNGTAVAEGITAHGSGLTTTWQHWDGWCCLPGGRLEPGASKVIEFDAHIDHLVGDKVRFGVSAWPRGPDANNADNEAWAFATVTRTFGDATGLIYGDQNRNGKPDQGEALEGATVELSGGIPRHTVRATTGPDGRFAFTGVNTGEYKVVYKLPAGWAVYGDPSLFTWTVEPGKPTDADVGATTTMTNVLGASLALDKDVYAVDDKVRLAVTLTNRATWDLTGVTARCNRWSEDNHLTPSAPGWGVLAPGGPGANVPAGQSVTIDVTDVVQKAARTHAKLWVVCSFAPGNGELDRVEASDSARVPGGFGDLAGILYYDTNPTQQGGLNEIPNTKILFLDEDTKKITARVTTDEHGRFEISDMPAGIYTTLVVGPWQPASWATQRVWVKADTENGTLVFVVPGPNVPDPETTTPTTPPPPPPGGGATPPPPLASTGASVIGLSIFGIGALIAGAGALFAARRRRT